MGKIVTVEYIDDLDGVSVNAENVDTVDFSYRGRDYSLVLTDKNGTQFDKDMARYITAANKAQARDARAARKKRRPEPRQSAKPAAPRTVPQTKSKATPHKSAATPVSDRERARTIRKWAEANGHRVSKRGRISAAIAEAYDAAH